MTLISHRVISDIFNLENVVQQTGMLQTKNILIDMLRDIFRQDRQFKYVDDVFGFPKTPSHLGLDPEAGLDDDETTRIFIGGTYRYDVKFNPSIIIKNTSSRYTPISFNQNLLCVINRLEVLQDGYGNQTTLSTPAYHTLVGAWDQTYEIKIITENEVDREEISDIVQVTLMSSRRLELQKAGVFIKTMSTSGETEVKYSNDYIYISSINIDVRTEFKIHIPISNVCEKIGMCLAFGTLNSATEADALTINQEITHADLL